MSEDFSHLDKHREAQAAYDELQGAKKRGDHKGHGKAAFCATFLAMKAYDHQAKKHGKEHIGTMKELGISLVAAGVDKLVEEKVIPAAEAELHKKQALKHYNELAEEREYAEY